MRGGNAFEQDTTLREADVLLYWRALSQYTTISGLIFILVSGPARRPQRGVGLSTDQHAGKRDQVV